MVVKSNWIVDKNDAMNTNKFKFTIECVILDNYYEIVHECCVCKQSIGMEINKYIV